jgi:hypothetical protein
MNRATAQTQKELSQEEGLAPILAWVKGLIDEIIADEFFAPDLEFIWSADPSIDPQTQPNIRASTAPDLRASSTAPAIFREEKRDKCSRCPSPWGSDAPRRG